MRIKQILNQYRRDFTAIYECEHCGFTYEGNGYDDVYFHNYVIPQMKCPSCKKTAGASYRPLSTKYPDNMQV